MRLVLSPFIAFFHSRPVTKVVGVILAFGGFVGLSVDLTPERTTLNYSNITVYEEDISLYIGNGSPNAVKNSEAVIFGRPDVSQIIRLGSIDDLGPETVQYL